MNVTDLSSEPDDARRGQGAGPAAQRSNGPAVELLLFAERLCCDLPKLWCSIALWLHSRCDVRLQCDLPNLICNCIAICRRFRKTADTCSIQAQRMSCTLRIGLGAAYKQLNHE